MKGPWNDDNSTFLKKLIEKGIPRQDIYDVASKYLGATKKDVDAEMIRLGISFSSKNEKQEGPWSSDKATFLEKIVKQGHSREDVYALANQYLGASEEDVDAQMARAELTFEGGEDPKEDIKEDPLPKRKKGINSKRLTKSVQKSSSFSSAIGKGLAGTGMVISRPASFLLSSGIEAAGTALLGPTMFRNVEKLARTSVLSRRNPQKKNVVEPQQIELIRIRVEGIEQLVGTMVKKFGNFLEGEELAGGTGRSSGGGWGNWGKMLAGLFGLRFLPRLLKYGKAGVSKLIRGGIGAGKKIIKKAKPLAKKAIKKARPLKKKAGKVLKKGAKLFGSQAKKAGKAAGKALGARLLSPALKFLAPALRILGPLGLVASGAMDLLSLKNWSFNSTHKELERLRKERDRGTPNENNKLWNPYDLLPWNKKDKEEEKKLEKQSMIKKGFTPASLGGGTGIPHFGELTFDAREIIFEASSIERRDSSGMPVFGRGGGFQQINYTQTPFEFPYTHPRKRNIQGSSSGGGNSIGSIPGGIPGMSSGIGTLSSGPSGPSSGIEYSPGMGSKSSSLESFLGKIPGTGSKVNAPSLPGMSSLSGISGITKSKGTPAIGEWGGTRLGEAGAHGYQRGGVSVKPWLVEATRFGVEKGLPEGYRAEVISTVDPRPSLYSRHPRGGAIDIQAYDPSGAKVPYLGSPLTPGYQVYEQAALAARQYQERFYPDEKFVWGGHFNSGVPFDRMHFQSGGVSARNFSPEQLSEPVVSESTMDEFFKQYHTSEPEEEIPSSDSTMLTGGGLEDILKGGDSAGPSIDTPLPPDPILPPSGSEAPSPSGRDSIAAAKKLQKLSEETAQANETTVRTVVKTIYVDTGGGKASTKQAKSSASRRTPGPSSTQDELSEKADMTPVESMMSR